MNQVKKLLLDALTLISEGDNDEAHDLVDRALDILSDMGDES